MAACGETPGVASYTTSTLGPIGHFIKELLMPMAFGAADVNLITDAETSPNITQSETFTWANPDNPNQVVVAYNDSRGRNQNPINISGASVSTDGGATFTRVTCANNTLPCVTARAPSAVPWETPLFSTTARSAPGSPSGSTPDAAVRAWAATSLPIPRTRIAGLTFAFTTIRTTTGILAGSITTRRLPSRTGCTSPITILMLVVGLFASPTPVITELPGMLR